MENIELKFKTNLNCGGCVSKVQSDFEMPKVFVIGMQIQTTATKSLP